MEPIRLSDNEFENGFWGRMKESFSSNNLFFRVHLDNTIRRLEEELSGFRDAKSKGEINKATMLLLDGVSNYHEVASGYAEQLGRLMELIPGRRNLIRPYLEKIRKIRDEYNEVRGDSNSQMA